MTSEVVAYYCLSTGRAYLADTKGLHSYHDAECCKPLMYMQTPSSCGNEDIAVLRLIIENALREERGLAYAPKVFADMLSMLDEVTVSRRGAE